MSKWVRLAGGRRGALENGGEGPSLSYLAVQGQRRRLGIDLCVLWNPPAGPSSSSGKSTTGGKGRWEREREREWLLRILRFSLRAPPSSLRLPSPFLRPFSRARPAGLAHSTSLVAFCLAKFRSSFLFSAAMTTNEGKERDVTSSQFGSVSSSRTSPFCASSLRRR